MIAHKAELRKTAKAKRASLSLAMRQYCTEGFIKSFFQAIDTKGKIIAGYAARHDELDVFPLLTLLTKKQVECCLPCVDPDSPLLAFRSWNPQSRFKVGPYNIREPEAILPLITPDILIVPLLAYDKNCHRLGYGAGYYDATIHHLRQNHKNVYCVGAAFSAQQVDDIGAELHDAILDCIVTEQGVLQSGT